jgi:hypothetical protein
MANGGNFTLPYPRFNCPVKRFMCHPNIPSKGKLIALNLLKFMINRDLPPNKDEHRWVKGWVLA